jgi:Glycosyl transferase family 2
VPRERHGGQPGCHCGEPGRHRLGRHDRGRAPVRCRPTHQVGDVHLSAAPRVGIDDEDSAATHPASRRAGAPKVSRTTHTGMPLSEAFGAFGRFAGQDVFVAPDEAVRETAARQTAARQPAAPTTPRVAVLIPLYNQTAFLPRALESLLGQRESAWEAVVLDDGSADPAEVADVVSAARDPRIRLIRSPSNRGLGATLNAGLDATAAELVAYLPADDVWFAEHLSRMIGAFADHAVVLARAALAEASGTDYAQLVQVAHRRVDDRWIERSELESDDLDRLYWARVSRRGRCVETRTRHLLLDPPSRTAVPRAAGGLRRRAQRVP